MADLLAEPNWLAAIVGGIAYFAIGALWYGPLFGKTWRAEKGLKYGLIHWAMITPWFEFYLPYNTMHEPLPLVLLECLFWFFVEICLVLVVSLIVNFHAGPFHEPVAYRKDPQ